jgi:hypothetical protein
VISLAGLRPEHGAPQPIRLALCAAGVMACLAPHLVGCREAPGEGVFTIRREGDHLVLESPAGWGLPTLRLRPERTHEFFVSELPLRVTMQTDSAGRVTGILVYPPRGQHAVPAHRLG